MKRRNERVKCLCRQLLKLIGVFLFLWILSHINSTAVLREIRAADKLLMLTSFLLIFAIYALKALRWHLLVKAVGLTQTVRQSWELYNIGIFLGTITPAKIGELGRAAYLRAHGMHSGTAVSLVILDRLADLFVIALLAIAGVGILFDPLWSLYGTGALVGGSILLWILWCRTQQFRASRAWLSHLETIQKIETATAISMTTLGSWILYFIWAGLVAKSLGITLAPLLLVSVFTITGILSLLPIAPSGLGTRDAALITLLAPYGISAERAVALALLMFASFVLSSTIGGWYWMHTTIQPSAPPQSD